MNTITVKRTLTANDMGKSRNGHGGVVIPNGPLQSDLMAFFGGARNQQEFIDVREPQKTYKLKYADYTSNGSTPNDRVTSINGYATHHGLEVCDTLVLERVDNAGEKTYLIDYVKNMQGIFLKGKKKDKAVVENASKFIDIMNAAKAEGIVTEPNPGEFHFDAKKGKTKKEVILKRDIDGEYEATFDGSPIGLSSKKSFEIDFSKKPAVLKQALDDWSIENNKPQIYSKYISTPYEVDECEDPVTDEDLNSVTGTYSPAPVDKKELREGKKGEKIYPRDKRISANALKRANNTCEHVNSHKSFTRRNKNVKYMEPHHLIPLHMHEEFEKSLDVEANIVCLCSNCHNQIHYGDSRKIIEHLWTLRGSELAAAGINHKIDGTIIDKDELLKMYGY